jgi:hypothetical protein
MPKLKTNNPLALRLLMTDDLYFIDEQNEQNNINDTDEFPEIPVDYLGENNKYILILVNSPEQYITSGDLNTLTMILKAKQLELRDVAILNLNKYPKDFNYLKEFFSCKKLVLFGINPQQIGLQDITSNQICLFKETSILTTYSFDEMQNDDSKKRLFWNVMKKL